MRVFRCQLMPPSRHWLRMNVVMTMYTWRTFSSCRTTLSRFIGGPTIMSNFRLKLLFFQNHNCDVLGWMSSEKIIINNNNNNNYKTRKWSQVTIWTVIFSSSCNHIELYTGTPNSISLKSSYYALMTSKTLAASWLESNK